MMRIPLSLLYAHQKPLANSHTHTNRAFRTNFAFFLGSKPKPLKLWYFTMQITYGFYKIFIASVYYYVQIITYLLMRTIVTEIGPNSYDVHRNNSVPIIFNNPV